MQNLIFCAVLENQKAGENKGFVFITALEHVYIKFIKINRIEFNRKEITIQSVFYEITNKRHFQKFEETTSCGLSTPRELEIKKYFFR